jgi:hypothetical protein
MVTSHVLNDREMVVRFLARAESFLFSVTPRPAVEPTQAPMVKWPGFSFPGVERPEHEADEG